MGSLNDLRFHKLKRVENLDNAVLIFKLKEYESLD